MALPSLRHEAGETEDGRVSGLRVCTGLGMSLLKRDPLSPAFSLTTRRTAVVLFPSCPVLLGPKSITSAVDLLQLASPEAGAGPLPGKVRHEPTTRMVGGRSALGIQRDQGWD